MSFLPDLRWLVGPAMIFIGACYLFLAWRLWFVHPINRVFRIGRFVTAEGLVAIINLRLLFAVHGTFFLVYGLAGVIFWFGGQSVFDPLVQFLGSLGATLGLWAAAMFVTALWRLWRAR